MSVYLSPVGLSTAPVANTLNVLATFKEKLCRSICATSTNQPNATVTYRNETPVFNNNTVFVPIVATVTITTPSDCGCCATTQVITERFMLAFSGQAALPTSVLLTPRGITQGLFKVQCGRSNCYAVNSLLTVSITPGTAPATASAAASMSNE